MWCKDCVQSAKIAFWNLDPPTKISSEEQEGRLKKVMLMIFTTTTMTNNQMHTTVKNKNKDEVE